MEEDEEVDIIGGFDVLSSKNERAISNISFGQILSCDYTVHPRWLSDINDAAELWPENLPKQSSQDEMEMVQDEVVIEEPAPIDFNWCEETSNCGDLILEKDIPTTLEEEVVTNIGKADTELDYEHFNKTNENYEKVATKQHLQKGPNPRSLLKKNMYDSKSKTISKFTKTLLINRSLLKTSRYLNATADITFKSHSPPGKIEQKNKTKNMRNKTPKQDKKVKCPKEETLDRRCKSLIIKRNVRSSVDRPNQTKGGKGKTNKKFVDLHGENITINHEMDFDTKKCDSDQIDTITTTPQQCTESDLEIDIESDDTSQPLTSNIDQIDSSKEIVLLEKPPDTPSPQSPPSTCSKSTHSRELHEVMESLVKPSEEFKIDQQTVTELEKYFHSEFFENRPTKTPERYMKIRRYILNAWEDAKPSYVGKTSVRTGLKNCGDVNCISRIHSLLEQIGAINFGHDGEHFSYIRPLSELYRNFTQLPQNRNYEYTANGSKNLKSKRRNRIKRNSESRKHIDANYTVSHDRHTPKLIVPHTAAKATEYKMEFRKRINPEYQLVQCNRFKPGQITPFKITITLSTLFCLKLHSLSASHEVMGFLGGYRSKSIGRNKISLTRYKPCQTSEQNGTMCEMCPVSQVEQSSSLIAEGNELLGWFHSHPTFSSNPSRTDVRTQEEMQHQFSYQLEKPFLMFILGCIDMEYKCMYILPEDLHNVKTECIPHEMNVDVVNDFTNFTKDVQDVFNVIDKQSENFPIILEKFAHCCNKLLKKFGHKKDILTYLKDILK